MSPGTSLGQQVAALMRAVAASVVLPRFRRLAAHDIAEKSPGEVVTSADLEAERRLADGLAALCPSARIIGEEAVAQDPGLLDRAGEGLVWLIDPLDGTANYARGQAPFGMMIALVDHGVPQAGWLLDPLRDRMCQAERGRGATCDREPVRARPTGAALPVAALGTHFLPAARRERVHAHAGRHCAVVAVPRCAAESYPRLVLGENDVALFQRSLPWDHAAGALFLEEAGGRITHWDGSPYRVGGAAGGILAAASAALWEQAARVLLGPEAGLIPAEAWAA
ncbi:inositol monophosphatase family protein [Novosphingobium album (ex Liu et al. 2023)]|uniref:Inositol monophosphatase n=1 Tax=Novosphingobium album (ex Liu et al. 2023) TaxID=3031130 RepID=A0ABT5WQL5_9SPHN|nr:inositol monophosphatase family protein [Novosphingobium album (ex Liu et al. 2023)]MDE8652341.1 inositol monophosphatase [Novosphingobium album (ex Liu et al. 2023)]